MAEGEIIRRYYGIAVSNAAFAAIEADKIIERVKKHGSGD